MANQKHSTRRAFLLEVGAVTTGVATSAALSSCGIDGAPTGDADRPPGRSDAGAAGTGGGTGGGNGGGGVPEGGGETCPPVAECATSATLPSKWDREADVVVLGTGFAGLSAAVAASDAGAKVLVLEKMPPHRGRRQ